MFVWHKVYAIVRAKKKQELSIVISRVLSRLLISFDAPKTTVGYIQGLNQDCAVWVKDSFQGMPTMSFVTVNL